MFTADKAALRGPPVRVARRRGGAGSSLRPGVRPPPPSRRGPGGARLIGRLWCPPRAAPFAHLLLLPLVGGAAPPVGRCPPLPAPASPPGGSRLGAPLRGPDAPGGAGPAGANSRWSGRGGPVLSVGCGAPPGHGPPRTGPAPPSPGPVALPRPGPSRVAGPAGPPLVPLRGTPELLFSGLGHSLPVNTHELKCHLASVLARFPTNSAAIFPYYSRC